jgi:myo-inositol-1(or 4)-monophosphatase
MDREAERIVLGVLRERFPDHGILSEECGRVGGSSEYLWVVDPLDGTFNYARGVPIWCTSLGLRRGNEPVLGVIYDASRDELFTAEKGAGAFLNGEPIAVSDTEELAYAVLALTLGLRDGREEESLRGSRQTSLQAAKGRAIGAAALELAYTACGRFDGYFEYSLYAWDVTAGLVLLGEAGARTSIRWRSETIADVAASNPHIHDDMLRAIGW